MIETAGPGLGRRRRRAPARSPRCAAPARAPTRSSSPPTTTARASSSATRRSRSCAATRSSAIPTTSPRRRRGEARRQAAAARPRPSLRPPPRADDGDPHVKPMLPAGSSTVTSACATRRSRPTRSRPLSPSPPRVDFNLAEAAHSRQDIDLIWGAVLTRFISLASYRYGSDYLSVGRVQTPTLRLVVDRELERRAFVPVPYWEIKADARARRRASSRWRTPRAASTRSTRPRPRSPAPRPRRPSSPPTRRSRARCAPPAPFNTTALMSAAAARRRLAGARHARRRVALPRRSHQLPAHRQHRLSARRLDLRGSLLRTRAAWSRSAEVAARLAGAGASSSPRRGKKRTTDHPPVYPVGVPVQGAQRRPRQGLRPRRAPLPGHAAAGGRHRGPAPRRAHRRASRSWPAAAGSPTRASCASTRSTARQARQAAAAVRRRRRVHRARGAQREQRDPAAVALQPEHAHREDGRARPGHQGDAGRHDPASLRPQLRARQPRRADRARHRPHRGLRRRSAGGADGHLLRRDDGPARAPHGRHQRGRAARATRSSPRARRCSSRPGSSSTATSSDIRDRIKSGVREDRDEGLVLGVCKNCGGQLKVLRGKTGKRFVACVGKEGESRRRGEGPDGKPPRPGCGQTFPLPQRGTIMPTGTTCAECGWPEIKVTGAGGRGRPWTLCLDMDCPSKEKYRAAQAATVVIPATLHRCRVRGGRRERPRPTGACSSPSKASTAAARPRRRPFSASASPPRPPGRLRRAPRGPSCASPAARRPAKPSATLLLHEPGTPSPPGRRRCSTPRRAPSSSSRCCCPQLDAGRLLVLDRYVDSSLAYQGTPAGSASSACWPSTRRATARPAARPHVRPRR